MPARFRSCVIWHLCFAICHFKWRCMPKTFFILAGEASGDKHAARLIAELKTQAPGARCVGMGGPAMTAAGFDAFKDLDGMQVVGFWEVAKKYGFFKKVFFELLDKLKQTRPDALICEIGRASCRGRV